MRAVAAHRVNTFFLERKYISKSGLRSRGNPGKAKQYYHGGCVLHAIAFLRLEEKSLRNICHTSRSAHI